MQNCLAFFSHHKTETCVFVLYLTITFFGIWYHEPWLDEAQAWIIARDCNLSELLEQMKYEGSPALWHLLIMPLAKCHIPYFSLNVFHWILAGAAIFIWLYFCPFGWGTRLCVVFSYSMLYEYAIKARCYTIAILFLFAISALYKHRLRYPILYGILVGLSCQTSLVCFGIAGGLGLLFAWDIFITPKKNEKTIASTHRQILAFTCMAFLGILAFLQVYPPKSVTPYHHVMSFQLPILKVWERYQDFVALHAPDPHGSFRYNNDVKYFLEIGYNVVIMILPLVVLLLTRTTKLFFLAILAFIPTFILHGFLARFWHRHYAFYIIFCLCILWIWQSEKKVDYLSAIQHKIFYILQRSIQFILIVSFPFAIFYTVSDWKLPHSGSKEIAQYIQKNNLEKYTIVVYYSSVGVPILPYLPSDMKFWHVHNQKYGTYMRWDNDHFCYETKLSIPEVIEWIKKYIPKKLPIILILTDVAAGDRTDPCLRLLYKNQGRVMNTVESYSIYMLE